MTIKALISDLGGVLLRTEDLEPRERLAARFGMTRAELENLVFSGEFGTQAQLGRITETDLWHKVTGRLGLPLEDATGVADQFWGGDRMDNHLVDYIRGLRSRYATGLLSNAFDGLRSRLENELKIDDAFDVIVISAEEGVMKPAPEIYRLAAERLGVTAQETVFLDDFQENVEGAEAVGMHAVHFRHPEQALEALRGLLDRSGTA